MTPLVANLEAVANNYLDLFREAEKAVTSGSSDRVERALSVLGRRREELLFLRKSIRSIARALYATGQPDLSRLARAIVKFLRFSHLQVWSTKTGSEELIEVLEQAQKAELTASEALAYISACKSNISNGWESVR